jgi:hypothetical protein
LGVAIAVAGLTTLALGGTERRPTTPPAIQTPRLRALWEKDPAVRAANVASDDEFAPADDDAPVMNVVTAGGLPEEPGRHDFEQAMLKIMPKLIACQSVEQLVGIVQVHLVIDKSGNVKSAQALPPIDQTQTGQCVAKESRHASFPRFRGTLTPTIELTYPIYFRPADN